MNKSPNCLYNYVSTVNQSYQTRNCDKFLQMCCRTEYFANSFFPYTIKEWNSLSPEIRKSVSYEVFKNSLLNITVPIATSYNKNKTWCGGKMQEKWRGKNLPW